MHKGGIIMPLTTKELQRPLYSLSVAAANLFSGNTKMLFLDEFTCTSRCLDDVYTTWQRRG